MNVYVITEWVGDAEMEFAVVDEQKSMTVDMDIKEYLEREFDVKIKTHQGTPIGNGGWEYTFHCTNGFDYKFFKRKFEFNKIGK